MSPTLMLPVVAGAVAAGVVAGLVAGGVVVVVELQAAISSAALAPAAVRLALFIREDTNIPRFLYTR
jgi:hypothetical protein